MHPKKLIAASLLAFAALSPAAHPAFAADAGDAPARWIVPTPPGGGSDGAARALAGAYSKVSGRQVVIENRPGANGAIAAQALIASAPDGRTLMWGFSSMAGIPVTQKSSPFRSLGDLTPVTATGQLTFAVFVNAELPVRTMADLGAHLRAQSGRVACGYGTLGEQLAALQWMKAAGVEATHVAYKGGAQLMPDLASGRIQMNIGPIAVGMPHVKAGRLRVLAVMTPQRSPLAPEVPTMAEAGYPSVSAPAWQALFAPPGTSPEVASRIARDVETALSSPDMATAMQPLGMSPERTGTATLATLVGQATQTWRTFAREQGLQPE